MLPDRLVILVIDDDDADAELARHSLQKEDSNAIVVTAGGVAEGIQAVSSMSVDVVLLDLSLEKTSGIETLRTFRAGAPDIPVVIWSGTVDEAMAFQTIEEGAQDFFNKDGVGQQWILMALRNAVQRHRLMRRLEQSNAEIEQLAYAASHDLQEPIRAISGYAQLLLRETSGKLEEKEFRHLKHIAEGASRIHQMTQDLLAYLGTTDNKSGNVALNICVNEACENLSLAIESCGANVSCESLPSVIGNQRQLTQVFQNLIGNALKYCSAEPPTIEIGAEANLNEVEISVTDNGIGIAPEHREKIFGLFKRLHHRDEYPGTGIGLAICKRVVARHNGTIWVNEHPAGAGSVFRIRLPLPHR